MNIINLFLLDGSTIRAKAKTLFESSNRLRLQITFMKTARQLTVADLMGATYMNTSYVISNLEETRIVCGCQVVDVELENIGCLT